MEGCKLLLSDIRHTRHGSPSHFLAQRGLSIWIDLDKLSEVNRKSLFFSIGHFNLVSFTEADHGPNFGRRKPAIPLSVYVRNVAKEVLPDTQVAYVRLLTFPRLMGFSFNPLSVYVAQDKDHKDILYIYEVRNTFGDMHSYVGAPSHQGCVLEVRKIFHVSPFFPVLGKYRLHVRHDDTRIKLAMRYIINGRPALTATMRGKLLPLTSRSLLRCLWLAGQWPLRTLAAIHIEAIKLWKKKLKFYRRPEPPTA